MSFHAPVALGEPAGTGLWVLELQSEAGCAGAEGQGGQELSTIQSIITQVAQSLGVPVPLALAMAQQESGFNPTAVGDNGTSFGLYQLHQGGELGSLTEQQAFNPSTNATVALTNLAAVLKANPGMDPGAAAAAAQRPANPSAYAASVDNILAGYETNGLPAGTPAGVPITNLLSNSGANQEPLTGPAGAATSASNPCQISIPLIGGCLWRASYSKAIIGGLLVGAGGLVMVLGVAFVGVYGLEGRPGQRVLNTAARVTSRPGPPAAPETETETETEPVAEQDSGMAA